MPCDCTVVLNLKAAVPTVVFVTEFVLTSRDVSGTAILMVTILLVWPGQMCNCHQEIVGQICVCDPC